MKTEILRSEPNVLTRSLIRVICAVKATTVEESAGYVLDVIRDVQEHKRRARTLRESTEATTGL